MPSVDNVQDIEPLDHYTASGGQTAFPYNFPIFEDDNLVVYDNDTLMALSTDYNVSGAGNDNGGNITFTSGRTAGHVITIYRDVPIERTTDIQQNGPRSSASMNDELDRMTMWMQQLERNTGRAIRLSLRNPQGSDDLEIDSAFAGRYLFVNSDLEVEPAASIATTTLTQSIIADLLTPQTAAEQGAGVTPLRTQFEPGDIQRYLASFTSDSTDCTNAIASAAAVSEVVQFPAGIVRFSQIQIPSGRGVIFQGKGSGTKTILRHTGSSRAVALTADDTQNVVFRDLTFYSSAATTSFMGFDDTTFDAFGIQFYNVEFNESNSGNNAVNWIHIAGSLTKQKHYFRGYGIKMFGGGRGLYLDGGAAGGFSNSHHFYGLQIQATTLDGILIDDSFTNIIAADVENCGDGVSTFNLRLEGAADDNVVFGRLENTIAPSQQVFLDNSTGDTNLFRGTMSQVPATANDLANTAEVVSNGIRYSRLQGRNKGLQRLLGANTSDVMLSAALSTDTMGLFGRFGLQASGRMGWSDDVTPPAWECEAFYSSVDGAFRFVLVPLRAPGLQTDTATPTGAAGIVSVGNTTRTTVGGAGGASALPATPRGYLEIDIGGTKRQIPYFDVP